MTLKLRSQLSMPSVKLAKELHPDLVNVVAASATPVLHHFGLSVAIGLSLVWLLAPVMRRR